MNHPFNEMKISSNSDLIGLKRSRCPSCLASRMYFCYKCYKYVEGVDIKLFPKVKLPLKIDIVKHSKELDGKSTAIHAVMLASDDVNIYTYPAIPNYSDQKDEVLLLYPSDEALSLSHYMKFGERNNHITDLEPFTNTVPTFKTIVLIDSTWNQVNGIRSDERLQNLRHVMLDTQKTNYWRSQHNCPDTYLATIEAIHLFVKQYHECFIGKYQGEYDNLLFFFKLFYEMVQKNKQFKLASRK